MAYTNSSLVSYTKLSPNHSGQRTHSIDRITPHCVVGQCSVETLGSIFLPTSRQASCNYGIGVDGRVGMYVEEKNRSWCTSSGENDNRAVTIETASDIKLPYAVTDRAFAALLDLCEDICRRNGKKNCCGSLTSRKPCHTRRSRTRWCSPSTAGSQTRPVPETTSTTATARSRRRSPGGWPAGPRCRP